MYIIYFKDNQITKLFESQNQADSFLSAFIRFLCYRREDLLDRLNIEHMLDSFEAFEELLLAHTATDSDLFDRNNYRIEANNVLYCVPTNI